MILGKGLSQKSIMQANAPAKAKFIVKRLWNPIWENKVWGASLDTGEELEAGVGFPEEDPTASGVEPLLSFEPPPVGGVDGDPAGRVLGGVAPGAGGFDAEGVGETAGAGEGTGADAAGGGADAAGPGAAVVLRILKIWPFER